MRKKAAHFTPGGKEFKTRLDQLFKVDGPEADREAVLIPRDIIDPDPNQPRRWFPVAKLRELARSLRTVGQVQPILVRPHPEADGRYMIVVGERRWRASAPDFDDGQGSVPELRAIVRRLTDFEVTHIQIEENDKREDVSPIAVARGYKRLYDTLFSREPGKNVQRWKRIATDVGLGERQLMRYIALLDLPEEMQRAIEEHGLTAQHGRALVNLAKYEKQQNILFRNMLRDEISGSEALRRSEEFRDALKTQEPPPQATSPPQTPAPEAQSSSMPSHEPTPATVGTGMAMPSEPTRTPSLTERRDVLRNHLGEVLRLLDDVKMQLPDLAGDKRFRRDVDESLAGTADIILEIRKGLK